MCDGYYVLSMSPAQRKTLVLPLRVSSCRASTRPQLPWKFQKHEHGPDAEGREATKPVTVGTSTSSHQSIGVQCFIKCGGGEPEKRGRGSDRGKNIDRPQGCGENKVASSPESWETAGVALADANKNATPRRNGRMGDLLFAARNAFLSDVAHRKGSPSKGIYRHDVLVS